MVELTLVKIVDKKVYLTLNPRYAVKIGATGTTSRNTYWVPKLTRTINNIVIDHGGEDNVNDDILDLLYSLRAETDFSEFQVKRKAYHELLRGYQNDGITLIREKGSFGLFWDPRTGKTPTTVIAIQKHKKVIIAVPSGVSLTWKREFEMWTKRKNIVVLANTPKKRQAQYEKFNKAKNMVLIGSYKTMANDVDYVYKKKPKKGFVHKGIWKPKPYDMIVLDEAHFLRNANSDQAVGIRKLRTYATHAVTLTGTPATNAAYDVIPILDFLHPGKYPKWGLIDYFFNKQQSRFGWEVGKVRSDRNTEWVEMLQEVSQQIKMRDVNEWVPEVVESIRYIQMTSKQEKVYKEMINDFRITDDEGDVIVREQNKLAQIGALIRLGLDPRIKDIDIKGAKTEWLREYFKENKDKPVIIVSPATSYLKLLNEELFDNQASMITGELSRKEKLQAQDDFQSGRTNVILLNTVAGSTNWTLDRADTTIFTNLDWNPTNNIQASQRMTPTKKVNVRGKKEIIHLSVEMSTRKTGDMSMDDLVRYAIKEKLSKTEIVNNFTKWIGNKRGR